MHTSTTPPIRHDWTLRELHELHNRPFPDLVFEAQATHRAHHDPTKVQLCTLLSIKTGGCPEDCAYCPQSARYQTGLDAEPLMELNDVVAAAEAARAAGSTRFCMGAAWRSAPRGKQFGRVLDMVRAVRSLGMEACCTLGMLEADQAEQLKEAGLTAYNHNLDTGPAFYGNIITTRTYEDRLHTLDRVRRAGITVCCGGIVGMGERLEDRLSMLQVLAAFDPHPESIPINALVRVAGTPLSTQPRVDPLSYVRLVATTRIVFPTSMVRLSAGRNEMSLEAQALCFLAGANSIFAGEKLLTTPNPVPDADARLFDALGLTPASSG